MGIIYSFFSKENWDLFNNALKNAHSDGKHEYRDASNAHKSQRKFHIVFSLQHTNSMAVVHMIILSAAVCREINDWAKTLFGEGNVKSFVACKKFQNKLIDPVMSFTHESSFIIDFSMPRQLCQQMLSITSNNINLKWIPHCCQNRYEFYF